MITLRKLQLKDVPLMLEWMHDEEAKHIFQNNFAEIDDVVRIFQTMRIETLVSGQGKTYILQLQTMNQMSI
mgnify:CR=1 FL=1